MDVLTRQTIREYLCLVGFRTLKGGYRGQMGRRCELIYDLTSPRSDALRLRDNREFVAVAPFESSKKRYYE